MGFQRAAEMKSLGFHSSRGLSRIFLLRVLRGHTESTAEYKLASAILNGVEAALTKGGVPGIRAVNHVIHSFYNIRNSGYVKINGTRFKTSGSPLRLPLVFHIWPLCAGKDSNLRRHKSLDLQSNAIDHSATDAMGRVYDMCRLFQNEDNGFALALFKEREPATEVPFREVLGYISYLYSV